MSEMDPRIKLLQRLKLQLSGYVYVGDRMKEGWKEPIQGGRSRFPIMPSIAPNMA